MNSTSLSFTQKFIRPARSILRSLKRTAFPLGIANIDGFSLYICKDDPRGTNLAKNRTLKKGSQRLRQFWKTADLFKPKYFVDVGSNYGEISLLRTYPKNTSVHLFDANPSVSKAVRASVRHHPNGAGGGQIFFRNVAVCDSARKVSLKVPKTSSGLGSIFNLESLYKDIPTRTFMIDAVKLDDCFPQIKDQFFVFKFDIEGAELAALKGAANLLEKNRFLAFVEVSSVYFEATNVSAKEFYSYLNQVSGGHIYYYDDTTAKFVNMGKKSPEEIFSEFGRLNKLLLYNDGRPYYVTDFLVFSPTIAQADIELYLSKASLA